MNEMCANHSEEDKTYTVTIAEIAEAQRADASLKHLFKCNAVVIDQGLEIKLIENTTCVCKDGWLIIPEPLQVLAVKWCQARSVRPLACVVLWAAVQY